MTRVMMGYQIAKIEVLLQSLTPSPVMTRGSILA
jgi:hypothetical protein